MPSKFLLNAIEVNLINPVFELAVLRRSRKGYVSTAPFASERQKEEVIFQYAHALRRLFQKEPKKRRITILAEVIIASWAIQNGENFKPSKVFCAWNDGVLLEALDLAKMFDSVLTVPELKPEEQAFTKELTAHQHWLEKRTQWIAQYLRYVHSYDVDNNEYLPSHESDIAGSGRNDAFPDWLENGQGLCSLHSVPDACLQKGQPLPVGLVTGKAIHMGERRWRLEYNELLLQELETKIGCILLSTLKETLGRIVDDMDGVWKTWFWVLDVPSLSNPQADFENRCAKYWEAQLELDVLKKAARRAKKECYSPPEAAELAARERAKFLARYSTIADAIVNVQTVDSLSEWDATLAAAWLKACIRRYPSVSKVLEWKYQGDGKSNWYDNWVNDLPSEIIDSVVASPSKFKNIAQLYKSHITTARREFREDSGPPQTFLRATKKKKSNNIQHAPSNDGNAASKSQLALDELVDSGELNHWRKLLSKNETQIFDLLRRNAGLNSTQLSYQLGRSAVQIRVEKKRMLDKIRRHVKR